MTRKQNDTLLKKGIVGSAMAAICCFTPILVIMIAGVGLSAFAGWLDYGLFPMLFGSLGVVAYAFWLRNGQPGRSPKSAILALVVLLSALLFWLEFRFALRISIAAALGVAGYGLFLRQWPRNNQQNG